MTEMWSIWTISYWRTVLWMVMKEMRMLLTLMAVWLLLDGCIHCDVSDRAQITCCQCWCEVAAFREPLTLHLLIKHQLSVSIDSDADGDFIMWMINVIVSSHTFWCFLFNASSSFLFPLIVSFQTDWLCEVRSENPRVDCNRHGAALQLVW